MFLLALPLFAAPQIAVYRNWDNVQVNRLDIVDFGATESNVPISRLFRIENHGNTTLNVSVSLDAQKSFAYSIIEFPAPTVAPGGSTTFRIRLQYSSEGTWFGYVNINSDDPVTPLFQFTTSGTVHGPFISVLQNSTFSAQPNNSTFDFGTIPSGTVTSRAWLINNSGTRALTISNSTTLVSGSGFVEIETPPVTINPGSSGLFRVRFAPTAPGTTYNGQVTILSNDTGQSPWTFFLTGRSN
jgi:hypothetical protein